MAKKDSLFGKIPYKIRFDTGDLGDEARLNAFQKQNEQAITAIERAIGDIHNTENATNSPLSDQQLFINSLGRALGSMANLVPVLSGTAENAPALWARMQDATYNVIPHPDQVIKCEVGCKFDGYDPSDAVPVRKCLAGFTNYYKKASGSSTGICQSTTCPGWSGRSGQYTNIVDCDPNIVSKSYRDYKLVAPTESRVTDRYSLKYYSNCGSSSYDIYRVDNGSTGYDSTDKTNPSKTWAIASNSSTTVNSVQYIYPNLSATNGYVVVVEVPATDVNQIISINNVNWGSVNGTSTQPTRFLFDLSQTEGISSLSVSITPATSTENATAIVSQIWIVEKDVTTHRNYGTPLLLPKALDRISAGTEVPPNFVQVFDANTLVNKVLDKVQVFKTRYAPPGASNLTTEREAIVIRIFDDQTLEVGNNRYLLVTTGTDVATTVGALLEAFVEHVNDINLHMTKEDACQILRDKAFCCDKFRAVVASLIPANRRVASPGAPYIIGLQFDGGQSPYTITVNWGDDSNSASPLIISGVQTFTVATDYNVGTIDGNGVPVTYQISHIYSTQGTYSPTLTVADNPDYFGCSAELSTSISPFNVGSPPVTDLEVRLDNISTYPNHVYMDINAGYQFTVTEDANWDSNPNYHILTQVHNTDPETGKPTEYTWIIDNDAGLTYQLYYENVTVSGETVTITAGTGQTTEPWLQHDSLVLSTAGGTVYTQGVDYTVNWISGIITVIPGQSIPQSATLEARYCHYAYMNLGDPPSSLDTTRWVILGTETMETAPGTGEIRLEDLTELTDRNTIRFKIREF